MGRHSLPGSGDSASGPADHGGGDEPSGRIPRADGGWQGRRRRTDGGRRRVVASPRPGRIVELGVIELLLRHNVVVVCAGGGGIPVIPADEGVMVGVEAVIDKDLTSALLARELGAEFLLMLTDVDAVHDRWGDPAARRIRRMAPEAIRELSFAPGTMGPKIEAALEFVETTGGIAGIGALEDAAKIIAGAAGTQIARYAETLWWD